MSHEDLDHGSAVYLSLTGCYHIRRSGIVPGKLCYWRGDSWKPAFQRYPTLPPYTLW